MGNFVFLFSKVDGENETENDSSGGMITKEMEEEEKKLTEKSEEMDKEMIEKVSSYDMVVVDFQTTSMTLVPAFVQILPAIL